jgi:hypothetical protein
MRFSDGSTVQNTKKNVSSEKEPKIRMGLSNGIYGIEPKSWKNDQNTKIFPKKTIFSTLRVKQSQKFA